MKQALLRFLLGAAVVPLGANVQARGAGEVYVATYVELIPNTAQLRTQRETFGPMTGALYDERLYRALA